MTTVIDERVVEMKFNNADFEKNVAQSMATLENLKKSLNFDSAKSLEELGKASKNFTLTGMTETLTEATTKFSALEIAGVTAIAKITSAAMDFGAKFVKSLSIDQVSTGFNKYAEKTTSVQTIIAATGESIEEVTSQIERLNWFTDETSYNLVDMTSNIAKFTSNGIKLQDAVTQMIGIANAAALSGANAEKASHAMTGFSKAMGEGKMTSQQWSWIQTAGMDTMAFKEALIDAAVAAGTLTKVSDGYFKTLEGNEVTLTNFETNMKDAWIIPEVMTSALENYGNFSQELYDSLEKIDWALTTSELLDYIEDYKAGTLDINELAEELGVSASDLHDVMTTLSDDALALGEKSFRAGQEAKTFGEAIGSVKDAVSTGWMTTFEMIFGNYEEAKKLWTGVANSMYDAFAEGGNVRNEVLKQWKELGGRDSLIMGAVRAANLFVKPLSVIKQAFGDMFPNVKGMAEGLKSMTDRFADLMQKLQPSEGMLKDIYLTFKGIFTIGKLLIDVFTGIIKAIAPVTRPFGSLLEMVLHFTGYLGAAIIVISEYIEKNGILKTVIETIVTAFKTFFGVIKDGAFVLGGVVLGTIVKVISLLTTGVTAIAKWVSDSKILQTVINKISSGINKLTGFIRKLLGVSDKTTTKIVKMKHYLSGNNTAIAETGTLTREATGDLKKSNTVLDLFLKLLKGAGTIVAGAVLTVLTAIKTIATNIFNFFKDFKTRFTDAKKNTKNFFDVIKAFFKTLFEMFGEVIGKIGEFFEGLGVDTDGVKTSIETIFTAVGTLLSKIDTGKIAAVAMAAALLALVGSFVKVADGIKTAFGAISGVFNNINKILKKQFMKSSVITDLAKSFAIIAGSLALLTFVDQDKLKSVGDVMLTLMIAFSACAAMLKVLDNMLVKSTLKSKISGIDGSILALAGSFALLAGVLALLNEVELKGGFKDWAAKLGIILLMMGEVVAATVIISKFTPKLAKGAILMLAVAASMKMLIDAIVTISNSPVDNIKGRLGEFSVLFVGLSAVIAAAGRIKLTSALSLILVAKALEKMWPVLTDLAKAIAGSNFGPIADAANNVLNSIRNFYHNLVNVFGEIGGNLTFLVSTLGGILVIMKLLTIMLPGLKDIGAFVASLGAAAAGFGVGFLAISKAFEIMSGAMKVMTPEQFSQIKSILTNFMLLMGSFIVVAQIIGVVSNVMGKKILKWTDNLQINFFGIAAAFVGIGVASILLAKSLDILANNIAPEKLAAPTGAMVALLAFLGIAAAGAGQITKAMPVIAGLTAIITAIAVLVAELMILSTLIKDQTTIVIPLAAMIGIMGMLALVCAEVSKIQVKQALSVMGMIVSVAVGLVGIGLALKLIASIKWTSLIKTIGLGVVPTVAILYTLLVALNELAKEMSLPRVKNVSILLGATVGSLIVLGAELYGLSRIKFSSLIKAIIGMTAVVVELGLLISFLGGVSKNITKANVRNIALLMATTVSALVVLGLELWRLSTIKSEDLWKAVGVMSVMTLVVSAFAGLMAVIQGVLFSTTAGAGNALLTAFIYSLAAAFIAFGAALALASVGFYVGAKAIEVLIPPIKELAGLVSSDPDLPGNLSFLALSLASLGVGLGVFGVGGAVGAVAIALLAAALNHLQPAVSSINADLETLATVDFQSIADGFTSLAVAGIVLGVGAGGVRDYSLALDQLTRAIGNFDSGVKNTNPAKTVETMYQGIDGTIVTQTSVTSQKAYASGEEIGDSVSGGVLSKEDDIQQAEKKAIDPLLNGVEIDAKTGMVKTKSSIETAWNNLTNWFGSTAKNNLSAATKSATEGVKDSISPVVKEEIDNAKTYAENSLNQLLGVFEGFAFKIKGILNSSNQEISQYGANGMPTSVIKQMYGGTAVYAKDMAGAYERLTDKIKVTGKGLVENDFILKELKKAFEDAKKEAEEFAKGIGGAGESAGAASSSLKDFASTVKDTIANQLDMFTKFDMKTGISADQMLENMRSNIDGFASWSHRMSVLAERFADHGIEGLWEKLAEMGPKGYETMNAFYTMSEEQLDQVRNLWATGLTLPDTQASIIGDGYKYIGEMMVKGVSTALDDHKALHASIHSLNEDGKKDFITDWKIGSPSKVTAEFGEYMVLGIVQGLNDQATRSWLIANVHSLCAEIKAEFTNPETGLSAEAFKEVGESIMTNFVEGVFVQAGLMSVEGFAKAFLALETVTENITSFCNSVKKLITAAFLIPMDDSGEASYSMVFYNYGLMMLEGLSTAFLPDSEKVVALMELIKAFCENIKKTFIDGWEMAGEDGALKRSEVFYEIGCYAMQGLIDGLEEKGAEAISTAEDIANQIREIIQSAWDEHSPSRVFKQIGWFAMEGLRIGMEDAAENVYKAARAVADTSVDEATSNIGRIQDAINIGMDMNPIITPMLDLSYLKAQMNEIDNLFASRELALSAQNEGGLSGSNGSGAVFNYTQNNYSPKALSRVEIYRQTQNQLSQVRKVVKGK